MFSFKLIGGFPHLSKFRMSHNFVYCCDAWQVICVNFHISQTIGNCSRTLRDGMKHMTVVSVLCCLSCHNENVLEQQLVISFVPNVSTADSICLISCMHTLRIWVRHL